MNHMNSRYPRYLRNTSSGLSRALLLLRLLVGAGCKTQSPDSSAAAVVVESVVEQISMAKLYPKDRRK